MSDREDTEMGGFVFGAVIASILWVFFTVSPPSQQRAHEACVDAGYHGGRYSRTQGTICFNYVSVKLP